MKPYNPKKFVPDMCKIAYNLTLKRPGLDIWKNYLLNDHNYLFFKF